MKYLATKACRFGGQDYSTGDIIEETAVDPKSVGALIEMGFIRKVDIPSPAPIESPSYSQSLTFDSQSKKKKKPTKVGDESVVDIQS